MRHLISLVVFCTLGLPPVHAQFAADRSRDPSAGTLPSGANESLQAMSKDLQEARDLLKRMPPSGNRDRIELLLARTELQLKQLVGKLGDSAKPKAISHEEFNRLAVNLRNQAFDKDKTAFLEVAVVGRHFTCDQAAQLLKLFSFDADRVKAAVTLHPLLIDPDHFKQVLDTFLFDGSKRSVMERLKGK